MRTENGLLRHVAVGTRPRDVNGVRSGDLLIGTRAFHGCLTILVNFSRRGAEGLNPRAAGAAKGSRMRIKNERTFSTLSRRLWRLRFLELRRRRRFRLAELARDPLELQLSAFRGPAP